MDPILYAKARTLLAKIEICNARVDLYRFGSPDAVALDAETKANADASSTEFRRKFAVERDAIERASTDRELEACISRMTAILYDFPANVANDIQEFAPGF